MAKISKTNAWAGGVACLAIALAAAGSALAQQQSQRDQSDQAQQQSSDQQDEQNASQSDSQSDQQARERQQQERKRQQQARERDQQARERQQQAREREEQARDREQQARERGEFRGESQWRDEQQISRDAERSAQRGDEQQAGLGVSVISDNREGVIVSRVHRGSPAEEMGIRTRDRITHVNGQEVQSVQGFISRIRNMEPGEEVEIDIRRSGDERTVRGELESREEALVLRGQQWGEQFGPPQRDRYGAQDRENSQTSYEEERSFDSSQGRSGQISSSRLDQIQRQVDRMSQELEDLRFALQDIRRQSGQSREPGQWDRERTASYDEYQRTIQSPRRSADRWDDSNRFRQSDRTRGIGRTSDYDSGQDIQRSRQSDSGQSGERSRQSDSDQRGAQSRESNEDRSGPGGEIGEERLRPQSDEQQRD